MHHLHNRLFVGIVCKCGAKRCLQGCRLTTLESAVQQCGAESGRTEPSGSEGRICCGGAELLCGALQQPS